MNRHLIVPLVLADGLAALALALGIGALVAPDLGLFAPLASARLGLPLVVLGALGLLACGVLMLRWFLASLRERGR